MLPTKTLSQNVKQRTPRALAFSVVALTILAACSIMATDVQAGSISEPETARPLRIGTEGAYPPFNSITSAGELVGFDIDIAKEVCARLNRTCQFTTLRWEGLIPGLLFGRYDAIVASMAITEKRKERVAFSRKYYNTPARFAGCIDGLGLPSDTAWPTQALDKLTVGIQGGTVHANYLAARHPDAEVRNYPTQQALHLDLLAGRIHLGLADSVVLYDWLESAPATCAFRGPPIHAPEIYGQGAGIALRKDNAPLKDAIDGALEAMIADGTYDAINARYFPFSIQ